MKKFTNNARLGLISMCLNLVILILVIISVVKLGTYDGKNIVLQDSIEKPYEKWQDSINNLMRSNEIAQNAIDGQMKNLDIARQDSAKHAAELAAATEKNVKDSINFKLENDKSHIESCLLALSDSSEYMLASNRVKDSLSAAQEVFKPIEKARTDSINEIRPILKSLIAIVVIAVVLLIIKFLVFGFWMYRNSLNVKYVAPWISKNKPVMNILAWFIPLYNLFKPCGLYSELLSETKDALRGKGLMKDSDDSGQMESMGLWWGSMLLARVLLPFFLVGGPFVCFNFWLLPALATANMENVSMGLLSMGAYFGNTGMFFYLRPHCIVMALLVIAWVVYVLYECYLIFSYNKLNKMMCDNESAFDVTEPTQIATPQVKKEDKETTQILNERNEETQVANDKAEATQITDESKSE